MNWWVTITGFELFVAGNAAFDYYKIEKKHWNIIHPIEGAIQLGVIVFFSLISKGHWQLNLFLYLSIFWLQFDYLLNIMRGKEWWHLGKAFFDQILKGYEKRYLRLLLKFAIFVIMLYLKIKL